MSTNSYPYLAFAREHGLDYGKVLNVTSGGDAGFMTWSQSCAFAVVHEQEQSRQRMSAVEDVARAQCYEHCDLAPCRSHLKKCRQRTDHPKLSEYLRDNGWIDPAVQLCERPIGPQPDQEVTHGF